MKRNKKYLWTESEIASQTICAVTILFDIIILCSLVRTRSIKWYIYMLYNMYIYFSTKNEEMKVLAHKIMYCVSVICIIKLTIWNYTHKYYIHTYMHII